MSNEQLVTVNVHNPRIKGVSRFSDGKLLVRLGNDATMQASVDLFVTDEAWDTIVADVSAQRVDAEVIPDSRQSTPAVKNEAL